MEDYSNTVLGMLVTVVNIIVYYRLKVTCVYLLFLHRDLPHYKGGRERII